MDGVGEEAGEAEVGAGDGAVHGQVEDPLAIYHHGRDLGGYSVEVPAGGYMDGLGA